MKKQPTNNREFDKMLRGSLYAPIDEEISKKHLKAFVLCEKFNRISAKRTKKKQRALEKLIPSAKDKGFAVFAPFYCEYGENITVGNDCFVNFSCVFLDVSPITLGNGVYIGANVTLATPNHPLLAEERLPNDYPIGRTDLEYSDPITIKDGCWICSGATICGGVEIGENSVVAAGAVVTRDVPPNSLVAGVPARVLRKIDESDRINVWETYVKNQKPTTDRKSGRLTARQNER